MTQRRETPPGRGRIITTRENLCEKENHRPESSQRDQGPVGIVKRCSLGMSYYDTYQLRVLLSGKSE